MAAWAGSGDGSCRPRGADSRVGFLLRSNIRTRHDQERRPSASFSLSDSRNTSTAEDGSFQFDGLPPGRYVVNAYFELDGIIASRPETEVEIGPGGIAAVEIPLRHLPRITGRIVDAADRPREIAGVKQISALLREEGKSSNWQVRARRRPMPRRPVHDPRRDRGISSINIYGGAGDGICSCRTRPSPAQQGDSKTDWTAPDLKLVPAPECDGIVVDGTGHPVPDAEVYFRAAERPGGGGGTHMPPPTGPDGTFHLDGLEADQLVALWARGGDATTGDPVVVRPRELKGKLTLTVDPKNAVRIRGLAVDSGGSPNNPQGARVTLRWITARVPRREGDASRWAPSGEPARDIQTTGVRWLVRLPETSGRGARTSLVVEARGYSKGEAPDLTGKAGETHDLGKMVLIDTSGYLAGRVVGSDGRPIAGAAVFNRGDGPEMIATSTDTEGRFRLEGMYSGTKYAFVRKPGYRFTGLKADGDADGLTIRAAQDGRAPPRLEARPARQPRRAASVRPAGLDPDLGEVRRGRR